MIKLTLDEAQTELRAESATVRWDRTPRRKAALLIGLDAMERIKAYRETRLYIHCMPLEGELLP